MKFLKHLARDFKGSRLELTHFMLSFVVIPKTRNPEPFSNYPEVNTHSPERLGQVLAADGRAST